MPMSPRLKCRHGLENRHCLPARFNATRTLQGIEGQQVACCAVRRRHRPPNRASCRSMSVHRARLVPAEDAAWHPAHQREAQLAACRVVARSTHVRRMPPRRRGATQHGCTMPCSVLPCRATGAPCPLPARSWPSRSLNSAGPSRNALARAFHRVLGLPQGCTIAYYSHGYRRGAIRCDNSPVVVM